MHFLFYINLKFNNETNSLNCLHFNSVLELEAFFYNLIINYSYLHKIKLALYLDLGFYIYDITIDNMTE